MLVRTFNRLKISDFLTMTSDLMRTIEDEDEVPDLSEESDEDDDGQPKKNRAARLVNKDFDAGFKFVGSQREYMEDKWNDLAKYCKKKAKTTLDDKGKTYHHFFSPVEVLQLEIM